MPVLFLLVLFISSLTPSTLHSPALACFLLLGIDSHSSPTSNLSIGRRVPWSIVLCVPPILLKAAWELSCPTPSAGFNYYFFLLLLALCGIILVLLCPQLNLILIPDRTVWMNQVRTALFQQTLSWASMPPSLPPLHRRFNSRQLEWPNSTPVLRSSGEMPWEPDQSFLLPNLLSTTSPNIMSTAHNLTKGTPTE